MRRRLREGLTGAVAAVLLTGCVGLPESGPVEDAGAAVAAGDEVVFDFSPPPPQAGETRTDIVKHFLEAMTATPQQTNTAREYLTVAAQADWDPEQQTIVYDDATRPASQSQAIVGVAMTDAYRLDSRGAFVGKVAPQDLTLRFAMDVEDGEWRIARLPNALIVPRTWTSDHFRSVEVYYTDPTAQILVPEPVTVPSGEQFATALMRSLLAGPGPSMAGVSRSFLPPGLSLELSDPVDADGVADVAFEGDASSMSVQEAELAAIQIAWTLRQDPSIQTVRLTADGEALPGLAREIRTDEGAEFDPSAFAASGEMFALRGGRVVSGPPEAMSPVAGEIGQRGYGLSAIALSLDSTQVAGLSGGRTAVLLAATYDPEAQVREVVSGATALLPPAWDFADRMWLIDRTPTGAQVSVVTDQRVRSVQVPGISAQRVRHFLVSRDGSRMLAVLRRPTRDVVVVSRLRYNDRGVMRSASRARVLPWPAVERPRISDLAWESPTSVAVLYPTRDLAQVRTLVVDGSPSTVSVASPTLTGDYRWLIGAPEPGADLLAATRLDYTELSEDIPREPLTADLDLTTLTYTG